MVRNFKTGFCIYKQRELGKQELGSYLNVKDYIVPGKTEIQQRDSVS